AAAPLRRLRRHAAQGALGAARSPRDRGAVERRRPLAEAAQRQLRELGADDAGRGAGRGAGAEGGMKAQTPMQVWKVPLVLGALSLVGLFVALVADGAGDVASWVALAAPT